MCFLGYCRWSAELNLSVRSNMKKNNSTRVGSEAQYGPRLAGEILHDYLENSNEPVARAYRERQAAAMKQGWSCNTHLCVDVKTFLRSDRIMKAGKTYLGMLKRDEADEELGFDDRHFTFVETLPMTEKRNPRVFEGQFITITRRDDGSYRPNFKPMRIGAEFNIDSYAIGVCNELRKGLKGLVEEG